MCVFLFSSWISAWWLSAPKWCISGLSLHFRENDEKSTVTCRISKIIYVKSSEMLHNQMEDHIILTSRDFPPDNQQMWWHNSSSAATLVMLCCHHHCSNPRESICQKGLIFVEKWLVWFFLVLHFERRIHSVVIICVVIPSFKFEFRDQLDEQWNFSQFD